MSLAVDFVTIGKILKPFGIHGDVRVEPLTDVSGRFEGLPPVTLVLPNGEHVDSAITRARKMNRFYALGFSDISSPEEAGRFRGAFIHMQQESVPPLPEAHYYQFELIGLEVQDETGRVLGKLEDVLELPHQHVFVVRQNEDELLIPAVRQVIRQVDVEAGIMKVARLEEWGIHDAV